jgi:large subunit ribosomal protein L11
MAPRKIARVVRLNIPAAEVSPARVGRDIGPLGINMPEFCRLYNEATTAQRGLIVPAVSTVFEDRSFTLETRTPTTASLFRRAAGVEAAAAHPNGTPVGWITRAQMREIAALKRPT